jgi:hypothetical protein
MADSPEEALFTIPGPYHMDDELAARAKELGLEDNFEQIRDEGYTIVYDAAPAELIERLRAKVVEMQHEIWDQFEIEGDARAGLGMNPRMLLGTDPAFNEAMLNPKVLALAEFTCGRGALAYQTGGSLRLKGTPELFLHADHIASIPPPFPAHNYIMTACWALTDWSKDGGSTMIVPGSNQHRRMPTQEESAAKEGAISFEAPAGSIALWDGSVWHGSWPQTEDRERVGLHMSYCRSALRTVEVYDHLGDDFVEEWGPQMGTLLKRDPGLLEGRTIEDMFPELAFR